jgi:hypothetical protein
MKRLSFLVLVVWVLTNLSCKKKSITFPLPYDFDVMIPATPVIPPNDPTITVPYDITINDSRLDHIQSATLSSFYLQITDPAGKTFNWCKEIHLMLSADSIPEIEVATALNIDSNATRVDFTVTKADLSSMLAKKKITTKIKLVLVQGFAQQLKIHGSMNFQVIAN